MEDMARLAVVEQSVRDNKKFNEILFELLWHISHILENPYDYGLRTLKSDKLIDVFNHEPFKDYLTYIGFQLEGSQFVYPRELTLNKLRMAQAAIERKISFCCGTKLDKINWKSNQRKSKKEELSPVNVLTTTNPFLLRIQDLFNHVLEYENEELQALAKEQIPLVTLQLMAIDRIREQQKKIKIGEIKEQDLSFDMALLMELLVWFKHKFFTWVDQPPCEKCNGPTVFKKTELANIDGDTCRVELFVCSSCGAGARFPRHQRPRTLLSTRRGRCGEWANCFALLCRALGYDTRYVFDTTDHVWCEIYDFESRNWVHVDPCETQLNAPLMYEHGWGKRLAYVIAVSRDDLQDVTWRYTLNHKQTLSRRSLCAEQELVCALLALRAQRQRPLSAPRRHHLTRRALAELVSLMHERKPTDYESHGRISGSRQWRSDRGEVGKGHTFEFCRAGPCTVRYYAGPDKYCVWEAGEETSSFKGWAAGVYRANKISRKIENDWQMVYLAREEDEGDGTVSWRFATSGDLRLTDMRLNVTTAVYETGTINWFVQYDQQEPQPLDLHDGGAWLAGGACGAVEVRALLRGGCGAAAWQHAQLCRTTLVDKSYAFEFCANIV